MKEEEIIGAKPAAAPSLPRDGGDGVPSLGAPSVTAEDAAAIQAKQEAEAAAAAAAAEEAETQEKADKERRGLEEAIAEIRIDPRKVLLHNLRFSYPANDDTFECRGYKRCAKVVIETLERLSSADELVAVGDVGAADLKREHGVGEHFTATRNFFGF